MDSRRIMEAQIDRTIDQMREVANDRQIQLVALGGDVRFAASQLVTDSSQAITRIPIGDLERFTDSMLSMSVDQIVNRYHMTLSDAETLGPALLTYLHIAREFGIPEILVAEFNLRGALLNEMAGFDGWAVGFSEQIVHSSLKLARKYHVALPRAQHIAALATTLFEQLADEHGLGSRWKTILNAAALLHETGMYVSTRSYHKHSMYIINNSKIFGLSPLDIQLVSLVARYHRQAHPKPSHVGYSSLDRDNRIAVSKAAAILRLAVCLDHSRSQRIRDIQCELTDKRLILQLRGVGDVSLEQLELKQKGQLFDDVFGLRVMLRPVR